MLKLVNIISKYYAESGRGHLPWRSTRDPYKVLVSEMMLQQTQVERVLPKYTEFLKAFPTVHALANASFPQVLQLWSGLGYNRRAKFLHEAAKEVVTKHDGKFPQAVSELEKLPGIGPYTARAIAAFAHNEPVVFIETNIRTVFIHSHILDLPVRQAGLPDRQAGNVGMKEGETVTDAEILPLVARALKESKMEPRDFYAALMDYGAFLKRSGVRVNNKSKHYTKQSKFQGSARQLRGAILRELLKAPATEGALQKTTKRSREEVDRELVRLVKEVIIQKKGNKFELRK